MRPPYTEKIPNYAYTIECVKLRNAEEMKPFTHAYHIARMGRTEHACDTVVNGVA